MMERLKQAFKRGMDLYGESSRKGEKDGASRYLAMNHADWRRARARVPSFSSFSSSFFFFFIIARSNSRRERLFLKSPHPHFDPSIGQFHDSIRYLLSFLSSSFFSKNILRIFTNLLVAQLVPSHSMRINMRNTRAEFPPHFPLNPDRKQTTHFHTRLFQSRILETRAADLRQGALHSTLGEIYGVSTFLCAMPKEKKRKEVYVVAFRGLGFGVDFVVDRVSRCTRSSPRTPSTDATWSRTKSRI